MITFVQVLNPFQPTSRGSCEAVAVDMAGSTIREVLDAHGVLEDGVFAVPTIVMLGNKPMLIEEWDNTPVMEGQVLVTTPVVQGAIPFSMVGGWCWVAAVAVKALSVNIPSTPQLGARPSLLPKGQSNQIKLGSPIESSYGRVRIWPSYGAKPYNRYIGNEAYQYQLFCLGQGSYEIEQQSGQDAIFIEDTPIQDFSDVEYEVVEPGGTSDLFRDNVQTSAEVGAIELFGPNEDEYDDWFEAVVNDAGTTTDVIELDLVFSKGLYRQNDDGGLSEVTVTASFEYIEIDDLGNETGSWQTLTDFSKTLATTEIKRFTVTANVPWARYKVRGRRTSDADDSFKVGDTLGRR